MLARVAFQLIPFVFVACFVPGIDWIDRGFLIALLVLSSLMTVGHRLGAAAGQAAAPARLRDQG